MSDYENYMKYVREHLFLAEQASQKIGHIREVKENLREATLWLVAASRALEGLK